MAKDTPSMAKNKIKRSLGAILDPHPSAKDISMLWGYFGHSCIYCGLSMDRTSRHGHLDHVIATSEGGNNSIYNHVLACAKCNGDEKREMDWLDFLRSKAKTDQEYNKRKLIVESWLAKNSVQNINQALNVEAEDIIAKALKDFDSAVEQMRTLRKSII